MKAAYIEWVDSTIFDEGRWAHIDNDFTPKTIRSIGWLLQDNDEYVVIASCEDGDTASCVSTIPRGCIQTLRIVNHDYNPLGWASPWATP